MQNISKQNQRISRQPRRLRRRQRRINHTQKSNWQVSHTHRHAQIQSQITNSGSHVELLFIQFLYNFIDCEIHAELDFPFQFCATNSFGAFRVFFFFFRPSECNRQWVECKEKFCLSIERNEASDQFYAITSDGQFAVDFCLWPVTLKRLPPLRILGNYVLYQWR